MDAWLLRKGQRFGPYARTDIESWAKSEQLQHGDLIWYPGLSSWIPAEQLRGPPPLPASPIHAPITNDELAIRRLAGYEKLSAIFWMILGILQVLSVYGIIAGAWNIFAAYTRFQIVPLINARNQNVPAAFEGLAGIIIIAVINLILGGVIGILFAIFDLIIRDQVLKNRHLFVGVGTSSAAVAA